MGLAEHRQASPIHHSTVIKDITAARSRRPSAVSLQSSPDREGVIKRIYDRGARTLDERIAEAENKPSLRFPASQAFLMGLFNSWFSLTRTSIEITQGMVSYYLPRNESPKKRKRGKDTA
jgi:hypothetical protein